MAQKLVYIAGVQARGDNQSIFGNRMRFEPEKLREIRHTHDWMQDDAWLFRWTLLPLLSRHSAHLRHQESRA